MNFFIEKIYVFFFYSFNAIEYCFKIYFVLWIILFNCNLCLANVVRNVGLLVDFSYIGLCFNRMGLC